MIDEQCDCEHIDCENNGVHIAGSCQVQDCYMFVVDGHRLHLCKDCVYRYLLNGATVRKA